MRQIVLGVVLLAATGAGAWLWLAESDNRPLDQPTAESTGPATAADESPPTPSRTETERPSTSEPATSSDPGRPEPDATPPPEPDPRPEDVVHLRLDLRNAVTNRQIATGIRYSLFATGHPTRADRIADDATPPLRVPVPRGWLASAPNALQPVLVVEAAGYEPSDRIQLADANAEQPLRIVLMPKAAGAGVRLRLRTADGPVEALLVELRRTTPNGPSESIWLRRTESTNGAYELPDIAPLTTPGARYRLIAQPLGSDGQPRAVAALRESFAFGGSERIDFVRTLEPGTRLTLTLRDATTGQPIDNTPCTLFSGTEALEMLWQEEAAPNRSARELAVQDGGPPTAGPALGLYALRPGRYRLRVAPQGGSAAAIEQIVTCHAGDQALDVRVPR